MAYETKTDVKCSWKWCVLITPIPYYNRWSYQVVAVKIMKEGSDEIAPNQDDMIGLEKSVKNIINFNVCMKVCVDLVITLWNDHDHVCDTLDIISSRSVVTIFWHIYERTRDCIGSIFCFRERVTHPFVFTTICRDIFCYKYLLCIFCVFYL